MHITHCGDGRVCRIKSGGRQLTLELEGGDRTDRILGLVWCLPPEVKNNESMVGIQKPEKWLRIPSTPGGGIADDGEGTTPHRWIRQEVMVAKIPRTRCKADSGARAQGRTHEKKGKRGHFTSKDKIEKPEKGGAQPTKLRSKL